MEFKELKLEALKLPSDEKEELAYSLLRSLDDEEDELDPEHERLWKEEIERRCREIDEGKAELISAEEVFAELRAELR